MSSDPNPRPESSEVESDRSQKPDSPEPEHNASDNPSPADAAPPEESPAAEQPPPPTDEPEPPVFQQRILIGSQRDPDAYRAKPKRDWLPVDTEPKQGDRHKKQGEADNGSGTDAVDEKLTSEKAPLSAETPLAEEPTSAETPPGESEAIAVKHFPPPSIRDRLPPELEDEFSQSLGDEPLDDLLAGDEAVTKQPVLEPESQHTGRVVAVHREDVFVELGSREQGTVPLKHFAEPPEPGHTLEVIVVRFNSEDGLYELTIPRVSADVGDWSDLAEGMTVETRITGHNSGGLECEVNHIRGFIPISQISLYRVENLEEFVDQKFTCLVTEANPERRNLVLSRRAILEREQEEARTKLLESLAPGQIHEGIVRKLVDFGAFVDLGGVDGLLHISQLGWGRVAHPSDVLTEGQSIKVKIEKVDLANNRISLGYRDMLENPWTNVATKYPVSSVTRGKVSKLMEFGAFVQLEPGVEGLVHISELSHKRVWRTSDVVNEGDEIEAVVLSVDPEAQRISLSMKDISPPPQPTEEKEMPEEEPPPPPRRKPSKPLKGGLGRSPGGEKFGLKW